MTAVVDAAPVQGGDVPPANADEYEARLRALLDDFDRERAIVLLVQRSSLSRGKFERMSDTKLRGWLRCELGAVDLFGPSYWKAIWKRLQ